MRVALRVTAASVAALLLSVGMQSGAAAQTGGQVASKRIASAVDRTTAAGTANVMMSTDVAATNRSTSDRTVASISISIAGS